MARENIKRFFNSGVYIDGCSLNRYILDNISYSLDDETTNISYDYESIELCLLKKVKEGLTEQAKRLGSRKRMNEFIRVAILNAVDNAWVEQVDYMQQLQAAVSGRAMAQRNLLLEYQNEAFESFEKMRNTVLEDAVRNILLSDIYVDGERKLHIVFP